MPGQISKHKRGHGTTWTHHQPSHRFNPYRGGGRSVSAPSTPRGGRSGYLGGHPASQHRTLVINHEGNESIGTTTPSTTDDGLYVDGAGNGWVSRHSRNLQIINADVYARNAEARDKAMRESLSNVIDLTDDSPIGSVAAAAAASFEVMVDGVPFSITKHGAKLVQIPGELATG